MPSQPSTSTHKKRTALVLGGGGITGGVYEVGALRALDEFLIGQTVNDFDIYVGVSAGSLVASLMAAGIEAKELFDGILGNSESRYPTLQRTDIYGLNLGELGRRLVGAPRVLAEGLLASLAGSAPTRDLVANLSALAPSGIFTNRPLEDYVRRLFEAVGAPTQFEDIEKELYIAAVNVDTGYRVMFGEPGTGDVEIPRAVRASATIPFLFTPTRIGGGDFIDGGFEQNLPIDVAIKHGAELVIAINPLVPVINAPRSQGWNLLGPNGTYLADRGGTFILDQAFRFLVHSRLRYSIQTLRQEHPDVDIVLIEPRPDDLKMFSYNIMRYSARRSLVLHGYQNTRSMLRSAVKEHQATFAAAGIQTAPASLASTAELENSFETSLLDDLVALTAKIPGFTHLADPDGAPETILD